MKRTWDIASYVLYVSRRKNAEIGGKWKGNLDRRFLVDTAEREVPPNLNLVRPMSNFRPRRPTNAEPNFRKGILQTLRTYRAINGERIRTVALRLENAGSVIIDITMSIVRSDPLHTMQSIPSINGLPKKIHPRLIVPKNLLVVLPILPMTPLLILLEQINCGSLFQ